MDWMQIFTLVTGVIYIILEIRQKNLMWIVGVATSLAAMWVFFRQGLYASFILNAYYLITAFIGLWQWGCDRKRLHASEAEAHSVNDEIHLNHLSGTVVLYSIVIIAAGTFALAWLMEIVENPMSYLDALVAVLSAVATWWLVRSYLEQWWLWIIADMLSTILCVTQGMWWMAGLYAAYTASALVGYFHWKKKGRYI